MGILIVMAIAFVATGVYGLRKNANASEGEYEVVCGRVVGFELGHTQSVGDGTSNNYAPVFEYEYGGRKYKSAHAIATNFFGKAVSKYKEGDTVQLRVYKSRPNEAVPNTIIGTNSNALASAICFVLAGVMIVIAIFVF